MSTAVLAVSLCGNNAVWKDKNKNTHMGSIDCAPRNSLLVDIVAFIRRNLALSLAGCFAADLMRSTYYHRITGRAWWPCTSYALGTYQYSFTMAEFVPSTAVAVAVVLSQRTLKNTKIQLKKND